MLAQDIISQFHTADSVQDLNQLYSDVSPPTMEALKDAIWDLLVSGDLVSECWVYSHLSGPNAMPVGCFEHSSEIPEVMEDDEAPDENGDYDCEIVEFQTRPHHIEVNFKRATKSFASDPSFIRRRSSVESTTINITYDLDGEETRTKVSTYVVETAAVPLSDRPWLEAVTRTTTREVDYVSEEDPTVEERLMDTSKSYPSVLLVSSDQGEVHKTPASAISSGSIPEGWYLSASDAAGNVEPLRGE